MKSKVILASLFAMLQSATSDGDAKIETDQNALNEHFAKMRDAGKNNQLSKRKEVHGAQIHPYHFYSKNFYRYIQTTRSKT